MSRLALLALVAVTLCACDIPGPETVSGGVARQFYAEVSRGEGPGMDPYADPALRTPAAAASYKRLSELLGEGEPSEVRDGAKTFVDHPGADAWTVIRHDYVYPHRTVSVVTTMRRRSAHAPWMLVGFQASAPDWSAPVAVGEAPPRL